MSLTALKEKSTQSKLLQDQVAVITGGSSGIGRAAALRLAGQGARICILDLKESNGETVKKEIEQAGSQAIVVEADVSQPAQVRDGIEAAFRQWNRLDIAFANAGMNGTLAPIEDMTPEQWDETITTNLKGTFLTVKFAIPHMKTKGGSIIITSSINGNRVFANFGMSAYSTSKAGQAAFAKMAALELARYRIRVNTICPGAIQTNINESTHPTAELNKIKIPVEYPAGNKPLEHKPGSPEQVADLVLFLASSQSSHITGTQIYIDGAESLL